jgi:hypothetical protein
MFTHSLVLVCIHLRSFKVHRFGTVEATILQIMALGHRQLHDLPAEFHECFPVISWRDTDRQHGDLTPIFLTYTSGVHSIELRI